MSIYEGIWIPLVTPFKNGQPAYDQAQQLCLKLFNAGVHGIVVCGTTGEAATLRDSEQRHMLSAILEVLPSTCPVLMGISGSDTRVLAEKVSGIKDSGLSGFLVSAPSYVRPSQEGIRRHFETIANATDKAIILYNIPARTGVNIDLSSVIALQRLANIVAVKECGGNQTQMTGLIDCTDLKIMCGDDAELFQSLWLGAHGAISAAAHIRPDLFVRLFELMRAGEIVLARALFENLLPLIQVLFCEPNPAPVKAALAMQGHIREELRLPMTPMSASGRIRLTETMEKIMALPAARKTAQLRIPFEQEIRTLSLT